ncbi:aldose 1-epimerase [Photobacterium kagoshimensis]|uniref:aldose 1-epimerase n=1 Tax=Photobacterium kagoshimensis TaxID=2910242 RepID=UPI003D138D0E
MATHTLENHTLKLVINERGGVIDAFQYTYNNGCEYVCNQGEEHAFDILRPRTKLSEHSAAEASMFPMVPMVNRIRGNSFEWQGRQVTLPINSQVDPDFFLHGDGWLTQWQLCRQNPQELWLELVMTSDIKSVCHYQAKQRFQLEQDSLIVTMTVTNLSEEAFPFGAGFHPFFYCLPDTQVQFSALGVWREDATYLPSDYTTAISTVFDFEQAKPIPNAWINNGYRMDKSGVTATLNHNNGLRVTLTSPCHYLQVYKPEGQAGFLCLEPQSQAVNAHSELASLATTPFDTTKNHESLTILAPKQSMQITMTIKVQATL